MEEWRDFHEGKWVNEINVSNFIKSNYEAYEGDESFLESPTEKTKRIWGKCEELLKEELEKHVLDIDTVNMSGITNFEAGYIDDDDVVRVLIGTPNSTSNYYNKGYDFLVNCYKDAVKGTPLEGRLEFDRDSTLGNGFGDALRGNKVDMLFGVGWTGSALDPYGLVEVYTTYDKRYNGAEDFSKIYMTVDLPAKYVEGEEAGEGVRTYTASAADWTNALKGKKIKVTRPEEGQDKPVEFECSFGTTVDYAIRGLVLAGIELCALEQYEMIPIAYDSSASLKGMKVNFYTEEYVYGVGRGGVKYMTFNYNDSEWAAFVASQNGKLNYKVSE